MVMRRSGQVGIAAVLLLALLLGAAGPLFAGCAAACPFGKVAAGHRCCLSAGIAPSMRTASCCETLRAAAPVETSRAVAPSPAMAFAPAPPVELPGAAVAAAPIADLPLGSPPLHEGIGLYTLHAAFLI
jgi:hypothetical protein